MNIEVFCCSGGMAEGFRRAGITFDFAFDKDVDACDSYERNHGHRPVQMDATDLLRMVRGGWSPGPIGLIVADPPCTPWSRAGKRQGLDDSRDMLRQTAELIALLKPMAYLIGNVPGLQDSTSWHVVQDVIGGLSAHGYCSNDYVELDAADFGVPQHRVRPFWFGHRVGDCIRWPCRTHGSPAECSAPTLPGMPRLLPWVTCREALAHIPVDELGRPVRLRWRSDLHPPSHPDEPSKVIPSSMPGNGGAVIAQRLPDPNRPPVSIDEPYRTVTKASEYQTALEWPWDRPSTTVFAGTPQTGGPGKGSPGSRLNAIVLSERAAAVLQGFPDGWVFSGKTKKARWSQIGQAMPIGLAQAVAESIVAWAEKHGVPLHGSKSLPQEENQRPHVLRAQSGDGAAHRKVAAPG